MGRAVIGLVLINEMLVEVLFLGYGCGKFCFSFFFGYSKCGVWCGEGRLFSLDVAWVLELVYGG